MSDHSEDETRRLLARSDYATLQSAVLTRKAGLRDILEEHGWTLSEFESANLDRILNCLKRMPPHDNEMQDCHTQ